MGTETLTERVRTGVKAELARRDMSALQLADHMGRNRNYIYERLRGEKSFSTDEIDEIARILHIGISQLIEAPKEKNPILAVSGAEDADGEAERCKA